MPFSWTNNFYWQQAARLEPLLRAALRAPMMDILRAEAASRSANQTNHTVWYCDEQAETCATFAVVWSALAGVLVLALALQLLAVSSRE